MRELKFRFYDSFNEYMDYSKSLSDFFERYNQTIKGDNKPSELMQYTSIKDKNGKEIYEGDILRTFEYNDKWDAGALGDVTWEAPMFRQNWKILLSKDGKKDFRDPIGTICSSVLSEREGSIEIIGNIYENKNLLKEN